MPEDWEEGGFAAYIHWPFCQAKCPYCDFNSHVSSQIDIPRWTRSYLDEIDRHAAALPGRVLTSIFFGGGTPSMMPPELVAAIIDRLRRSWSTANDLEVTLEANPTSVEAARFRGYRDAGVTRLSLGVQALNDTDLRRLGRLHDTAQARTAFDLARDTFDRVSFDLIYARQHQSLDAWRNELAEALTLAADHLSLYQLTIEDGTAFGDRFRAGKLPGLPDEDLSADMYDLTLDMCAAHGFEAYEVSNLALPGAESRHNRVYWRYGDYIGIGPGAHGRLTYDGIRHAVENPRMPGAWLAAAGSETGATQSQPLTREDEAAEHLLMGLRLTEGIDLARAKRLSGREYVPAAVRELTDLGLIHVTGGRLAATRKGRLVLNAVIGSLVADG